MKVTLLIIGKTDSDQLNDLITIYTNRLKHYVNFDMIIIPDIKNTKNMTEQVQKEKEGEEILKRVTKGDYLVLLDEKGRSFSSVKFAGFIQKKMNSGLKNLVFVIGGPYGFADELHLRTNFKLSLSQMTFSHQMVRLFFVEQLYRAFTILQNEPYHHK